MLYLPTLTREQKKVGGMDELKSLKAKAAPKFERMAKEAKDNNTKLDKNNELLNTQIVLLARLCELKEDQRDGENKFREDWENAKRKDTHIGLWVLVLANVALYLDVIKIDSDGVVINTIVDTIKFVSYMFM